MMIWTEHSKIMGSLFKKTKQTYTGKGLEFNLLIDSASSALITISATARRNFKGQYMSSVPTVSSISSLGTFKTRRLRSKQTDDRLDPGCHVMWLNNQGYYSD